VGAPVVCVSCFVPLKSPSLTCCGLHDGLCTLRQLAADLEEEELLSHQASQERAWAALKELIDVRPDRAFQRDAVLKALDDSDPKAAKFVTGLIARASDGDATVVDDLNTMTVRGEASFVAPALAALKAHGDAQKLSK
jgi:hypothetical protein